MHPEKTTTKSARMKKLFISLLFLLPLLAFAQTNLSDIRRKSYTSQVYRITAKDAIEYYKKDTIPVKQFVSKIPNFSFHADSLNEEALPTGFYIIISTEGSHLLSSMYNKTSLRTILVNNTKYLQIDIRNKSGESVQASNVLINYKQAFFNNTSKTFCSKHKIKDDATVIVMAPGDTMIAEISAKDNLYYSIKEQKKINFRNSFFYKTWRKIKMPFMKAPKKNSINARGYMVFSKPKYKPKDTVRFKAYVFDKKQRPYSKAVNLYLKYYARGKYQEIFLKKIKASAAAAYYDEFVLGDSIPSDISCTLNFVTDDKKFILNQAFPIEEYVLDEIGTQGFKSNQDVFYKGDSLIFSAYAKDANGLNIMDAKAKLILLSGKIDTFFKDKHFVADTLYQKEIPLATQGDTKFVIQTDSFPLVNMAMLAKLIFKNSNNEIQEKILNLTYRYELKDLQVVQKNDSLFVKWMHNNVSVKTKGTMSNDNGPAYTVEFPFGVKINPMAEDYVFVAATDSFYFTKKYSITGNYQLGFERISKADTLGFVLLNPYKIPVYYTVTNGDKIIATGSNENENIQWQNKMNNPRQSYEVRWQYYWGGEEYSKNQTIGLLYKVLNASVSYMPKVSPGQSDSIKVRLKDYKGRPAPGVNLTALSYNNQFGEIANVKEPPYMVNYKHRNGIIRDGFDVDENGKMVLTLKYLLGNNREWVKKLSADTMEYYKMLFPGNSGFNAGRYVESAILPQVAVHITDNGLPQEIYLLYINNELVYYNAVTEKMKYSFPVWPKNVKLGIRLRDKYIEIDSLYFQPLYKHDISFDIKHLPKASRIIPANTWWSNSEMNTIERNMWQMRGNTGNDDGWVWQNYKLVKLNGHRNHIVGPFKEYQPITFYKEKDFDISIPFEPGYEYSLSKQISRLEKKPIFANKGIKNMLPIFNRQYLTLGDTLVSPPVINYEIVKPTQARFIYLSDVYQYLYNANLPGKGKLSLNFPKQTIIKYVIVQNNDSLLQRIVYQPGYSFLKNLNPGRYSIFIVNDKDASLEISNVFIKANGTTGINIDTNGYILNHPFVEKLYLESDSIYQMALNKAKEQREKNNKNEAPKELKSIKHSNTGTAVIYGKVTDKKGGLPIPFAAVVIKGGGGVVANVDGEYEIKNIESANVVLQFSSTAYSMIELNVAFIKGIARRYDIQLEQNDNSMAEVVVTSAFSTKRSVRSVSSNVQFVYGEELTKVQSNLNNALAGKVAGIEIRSQQSRKLGAETLIRLRGENILQGKGDIIYVVDGIVYEKPVDISPDLVVDITILQPLDAMAIYGSKAANGAIVITTKTKQNRSEFRDYAYWSPQFFTNKNGEAAIKVSYPDNVTSWKNFIVGMDKKRRIVKTSFLTRVYKPMQAQLNLPLFLLEGDSAAFVGKALNYTEDTYSLKSEFKVDDRVLHTKSFNLAGNDAAIEYLPVQAKADTIKASFAIKSSTGFADSEERKIPVLKLGLEQSEGAFYILNKDTGIQYFVKPGKGKLHLYAQNNTLDVLLQEIEHLRKYPYYCVEQMTSKFRGLAMEKQIREKLEQPFENKKEMEALLRKIQKAQNFDGGWPWWEGGNSNVYITNYIVSSLLPLRNDPLIETNLRNGLLFLQNHLPNLGNKELLATLHTLCKANHETGYLQWMSKIKFDSLRQHEQWLWVKIMQAQKQAYQKQLDSLLAKKSESMLGAVHWGTENYLWHSNEIASTILALEILQKENGKESLVNGILQYFLESRRGGFWRNTVESASILNAILPELLNSKTNFNSSASLHITGDTSFMINSFPFETTLTTDGLKKLNIQKSGGGMVYFTAYQNWFNANPSSNTKQFIVKTFFEKNGQQQTTVSTGERMKMILELEVLKDADYVMINMPIPAGCIFTEKDKARWMTHKEYYKDKMMLFAERLPKGNYRFEATLEPRYSGIYSLNPAKAELMYFPIFYGNNEIKKVEIVNP